MSDRRPPSYNKQILEAFTVSNDGVLRVDVDNHHFRKELLKQIRLLRPKTKIYKR